MPRIRNKQNYQPSLPPRPWYVVCIADLGRVMLHKVVPYECTAYRYGTGTIQAALCTVPVCSKPYGTGKKSTRACTDNQWLSQRICCISVNAYQARNLCSEVCILVCIRTKKNRWAWYSCLLMTQQKKDSPLPPKIIQANSKECMVMITHKNMSWTMSLKGQ